jgi:hypothetical protein
VHALCGPGDSDGVDDELCPLDEQSPVAIGGDDTPSLAWSQDLLADLGGCRMRD